MTNELRLTFARRGKGWRFTLHPNWSAQPSEPAPFRSPLAEKDYEDLRWYLEEFMDFPGAGDHIRARDVEGRLEAWGRDLYEQLFGHSDRRELLNDLLDSDPPQVLSVASQESEVLRLPWELLRDHRGPFTRRGITIRRQFEGGRWRLDYPAGLPLRILLVVSRPDDLGFIDPRSTTRGMLDALDTLAGDVQVDFCRPPTLPRLEEMLAEASRLGEPYHILHFDGHGTYMPTIGLGALCFEKETATGDCPTDLVPANRMGDLLAAENIPLAILEACRSGAVARQPVFRSVAPRLVESGVGSVVAMRAARWRLAALPSWPTRTAGWPTTPRRASRCRTGSCPTSTNGWRMRPWCPPAPVTPRLSPLPLAGEGPGVRADEAQRRFVDVYRAVMHAVDSAFFGENPRAGMEVMAREEGNLRLAVQRALELGDTAAAAALGGTMGKYLQRAGRLGERDRWAGWLAEQVAGAGWSEQAAATERDAAWVLLSQGQPREAIQRLEGLIGRLETTTEFDPTFQLALANSYLGRVYYHTGLAEQAIPVLEQAVQQWEALGEEQRGNLATCLGSLANALMIAGRLDEALESNERALKMYQEMGIEREVAVNHGRSARILAMQGRHAEADARYERALGAARAAGDQDLEGSLLQHQGGLADDRGDLDRAARLYKEALKRFQAMNAEDGIMQTCNLLGIVEQQAGRLAAARGWYEKTRELARRRGDSEHLGIVAQNLGVVVQEEGEAARQAGDEALARLKFQEAVQSIQESLEMKLHRGDRVGQATSLSQLGRLYLLLGNGSAEPAEALARAEEHAHRAREIREELRLPDVWRCYETLEDIARARGDAAGAAAWQHKKEAVREELRRRAGGGVPQTFVGAVGMLCLAVGQAALAGEALPPQVEENLATLEEAPAPWGQVGRFLQAVAAHRRPLPPVPSGLPEELAQLLEALKRELGA